MNQTHTGLFLKPGLGKTPIALTAIHDLIYETLDIQRVLVISPLRIARFVWRQEALKWDHLTGLRFSSVLGDAGARRRALSKDADIYLINRENIEWLVDYLAPEWPFDMVVIDESSSFKSPSADRFRALRKVITLSKRVVELTGSPAGNSYLGLWSQLYLLDRGERLERRFGQYRERYFAGIKNTGYEYVRSWTLKKGAEEIIQSKIADICISMRPEDWMTMKETTNNFIPVYMEGAVREGYDKLEKDSLLNLDVGTITAVNGAALMTKLLQYCSGAAYDANKEVLPVHDLKLEALGGLVEELNGDPLIVYYWYQHELDRITTYLKKQGITVRTLKTQRDIDDWNEGKITVLAANPQSAGHGLNLQFGGKNICWYTLPYSYELYDQANSRLTGARQVFDKAVIHHLITENSIDQAILKSLERKEANQDGLLEALKVRVEDVQRRYLHEVGG